MYRTAPADRMVRVMRVAVIASMVLACSSPALAQKTDVVVLKNGDRLTGQVKGADQGRLQLSTDSAGTVNIETEEIAEITSSARFVVEDTAGRIHVGTLRPAGSGRLAVVLADGTDIALDLASIFRLQPLGRTFWRQLDGSVDLGAGYTHSSGIGQGSFATAVTYRRPAFESAVRLDSNVTLQEASAPTSRTQLQLSYTKIFSNRWIGPGIGQFENNSDLGLKLRSTVGGGIGRMLVSTIRQRLTVAGGAALSREIPSEGASTTNVEAFVAVTHSYITYNTPKTELSTRTFVFPSLSDPGRLRLTLDTRVRRELLKDFTVGLSVYDSFDNRPPTDTAARNDVGVSVTAGWSF